MVKVTRSGRSPACEQGENDEQTGFAMHATCPKGVKAIQVPILIKTLNSIFAIGNSS